MLAALREQPGPAYNHARYLLKSACFPVYDNSEAVYYPGGEPCFKSMSVILFSVRSE